MASAAAGVYDAIERRLAIGASQHGGVRGVHPTARGFRVMRGPVHAAWTLALVEALPGGYPGAVHRRSGLSRSPVADPTPRMPSLPRTGAPLAGPRCARAGAVLRRLLPGVVVLALLP